MHSKKRTIWPWLAASAIAAFMLLRAPDHQEATHAHGEQDAAAGDERGPHRGRLLRDGDIAVEVTIFEEGVAPHYRVYVYANDKPIAPANAVITLSQTRLDGEVERFSFTAEGDYLKGSGTVEEPHSFDVEVNATIAGTPHQWQYASYEGRTMINASAAAAAGIRTSQAGPATIRNTLPLSGRIELNKNATTTVRARFPGVIREVNAEQGQAVAKGDVLLRIESNDSLQVYSVTAPMGGIVLSRNAAVGEMASDQPLFVISDLATVWAELHAFPKDAAKVAINQPVRIRSTGDGPTGDGMITALLPIAETTTQTVIARVPLDNSSHQWRTGMTVTGEVTTAEQHVPLAVKNSGLQRFRDFTVVFAKVRDSYEVRMLALGQSDGEFTEVLSGIKPGQDYVSENSFLIKADIEKSGASHDH